LPAKLLYRLPAGALYPACGCSFQPLTKEPSRLTPPHTKGDKMCDRSSSLPLKFPFTLFVKCLFKDRQV
ncbi:hypothetical protein BaRGS_00007005, partial [Batillaria attramentaria]